MDNKIKIGILGCGGVAHRWYLKGLSNINKNYELVAVADIIEDKAKEAAAKYNIPFYYSSIEDLANHPEVELIVILTRHEDHYKNIKYCFDKGLNVYSEKPFAETSKEAEELIEIANKKNIIFGAAPQIMFSSRNKVVKETIENNKIGKITLIRASNSNMGPADRKGVEYDPRWFYQDGSSLKSLGIYTLSTLIWLMGTPLRIAGLSGTSIPQREVMYGPFKGNKFDVTIPDNEVAMIEFENNCYALFDGSYSVLNPPKYEFEIQGTKATLLVSGFGGKESVILHEREKDPIAIGPDDDCHIKWNLSWAVEDTIMSITEKRKPIANPEFALIVIKAIEAIQDSSKQGIYKEI